jgi:hypothetical protein
MSTQMPDSAEHNAGVDPEPADTQTINVPDEGGNSDVNSADEEPASETDDEDPTPPLAPTPADTAIGTTAVTTKDTTPVVHELKVNTTATQTDIAVKIFHEAEGWIVKRLVLTGKLTSAKLSEVLADVRNW